MDTAGQENENSKSDALSDAVAEKLGRLTIVQLLTAIIVFSVVVSLSFLALSLVATYRESRVPQLMELELEKVAHQGLEIKRALEIRSEKSFVASQTGFPMTLEQLQFPRFPRYGEVFLSKSGGKTVRVGGTLDGKIWVDLTPFDPNLPKSPVGMTYLMTTFAELVSVSDRELLPATGKISNRDIVRAFFQSGVDQNVRILSREEGDILVGYKSIAGTNLVLFAEKPLTGLLAPLNEMLATVLLGTFMASLAVALVSFLLIKVHLRPLSKLKVYAGSMVMGQGKVQRAAPILHATSEFAVISESYQILEKKVQRAEVMAQSIVNYTRLLQIFQRAVTEQNDVPGCALSLGEIAINLLQPMAAHRVFVVLRNQLQPHVPFCTVQECSHASGRASLSSPTLSNDPEVLSLFGRYPGLAAPVFDKIGVHLPLVYGGGVFGFITLKNYPNAVHYRMVEPHLSIATHLVGDKFASNNRMMNNFFEDISTFIQRAQEGMMQHGNTFAGQIAQSSGQAVQSSGQAVQFAGQAVQASVPAASSGNTNVQMSVSADVQVPSRPSSKKSTSKKGAPVEPSAAIDSSTSAGTVGDDFPDLGDAGDRGNRSA